jgi:hypothetical protein
MCLLKIYVDKGNSSKRLVADGIDLFAVLFRNIEGLP